MLTRNDYPLANNRPELIFTPSGKSIEEINIDNILSKELSAQDVRISSQTLEYQAQIAEDAGNWQMASNLRRAAELTKVPDDMVMHIYNSLRPFRSTKEELTEIANELEKDYNAVICAEFIREAIAAYEKSNKFRK